MKKQFRKTREAARTAEAPRCSRRKKWNGEKQAPDKNETGGTTRRRVQRRATGRNSVTCVKYFVMFQCNKACRAMLHRVKGRCSPHSTRNTHPGMHTGRAVSSLTPDRHNG